MLSSLLHHAFNPKDEHEKNNARDPDMLDGLDYRILLIGIFEIHPGACAAHCSNYLSDRIADCFIQEGYVVLAFGMRLPIVAFAAARLATFNRNDLTNFALSESPYIIWTVTQINYSLISTTLPILRPFIKDLAAFYGAMRPSEYSSHSRSHSYPLSSLRSKQSNARNGSIIKPRQKFLPQDKLDTFDFGQPVRPDVFTSTNCECDVQGGPSRVSEEPETSTHSLGSEDSQRMI